jgi:prepilin-type N-terminal cleavage/methylation domain-containing protein/prepilin-type processing-associated H-X9-DG protein
MLNGTVKTTNEVVARGRVVHCRNRLGSAPTSSPRSGFTLIELLVVIAIIAILASLSAGALSRAKGEGKKAVCIGNFRQLQLAWEMYIDDQNRRLPYNRPSVGAGELEDLPNWVAGWLQTKDDWLDNTNTSKLVSAYGGIGVYLSEPKIFRCPGDKSVARISGFLYPRVRSVAMNDFMGPESDSPPASTLRSYRTLEDLAAGLPVENGFVLIDVHEDSIGNGMFIVPQPPAWAHFPASRHNGGATLSFTDGHVLCHKWQDPRTYQPVSGKYLYGVWQTNNLDMKWLHDRATAPKPLYAQ